jgi:hypothetical protein
MEAMRDNRRIVLIVLVALLLLCLVGVLVFNLYFANNTTTGGGEPTLALPTEEVALTTPESGEEEATATPTRVISEEGTVEEGEEGAGGETPTATPEVVAGPTETPTLAPTPAQAAASGSGGGDFSPSTSDQPPTLVETIKMDELLENGSFEEGFDSSGVGEGWDSFRSEGAAIAFSPETAEIYIKDGDNAQKISVDNVQSPDRYAGIYQTVSVIPGETYTLTLHGQIRSPLGDIQASSYGYRVQYAVADEGSEDWRDVPAEDWVELPWDERLIGSPTITYSRYMAPLRANSEEITLFVRTWNKWMASGLTEYTLDSLSLIGPVKRQELITPTTTTPLTSAGGGQLINEPLPITGLNNNKLMADPRFWGGVVVLSFLIVGAIYRGKWHW